MTKNYLVSLHKSMVSFISFCALHKVSLILSFGTLTLTDIEHVRSMKSCVYPRQKRDGITGQSETKKHANIYRELNPARFLYWLIGTKTRRYKETHTRLDGQSHLMIITQTSTFRKEGIATHS